MKKLVSLISIFISFNTYAVFPKISANGVSGDYKNGEGRAFAEHVEYELPEVKLTHKNIDVSFNKPEKNLIIFDRNTTVSIKFDFSFMNVFKVFDFKNVEIASEEKKFKFNVAQMHMMLGPQEFTLNNVVLKADLTNYKFDSEISFLEGFILNGLASVDDIFLGNYLNNELSSLLSKEKSFIPVSGRLATVSIDKEVFNGQVLLDSWVNLWLRFDGTISLNKERTKLEIVLNKAKLGYLSIRKIVLNKLAQIQNEKIKVEGNKVIIEFDSAAKK